MAGKAKLVMGWKDWLICYAASLGAGGLSWWVTGNQWVGFGCIVMTTAAYVLFVKARDASAEPKVVSTEGMSRQQRRAHERKNKQA